MFKGWFSMLFRSLLMASDTFLLTRWTDSKWVTRSREYHGTWNVKVEANFSGFQRVNCDHNMMDGEELIRKYTGTAYHRGFDALPVNMLTSRYGNYVHFTSLSRGEATALMVGGFPSETVSNADPCNFSDLNKLLNKKRSRWFARPRPYDYHGTSLSL